MNKINEIIYLPSIRCNLNCIHCGEMQDVTKSEEVDCTRILYELERSFLIDVPTIVISGGEPFLNDTFPRFIIEGMVRTNYNFSITTNGYFIEKIREIIENINIEDRSRISFQISVDGLKKTHNKIRRNKYSFDKAEDTITYLADKGIQLSVNTVVQKNNIKELEVLNKYFKNISPDIHVNFIPLAVDISERGG